MTRRPAGAAVLLVTLVVVVLVAHASSNRVVRGSAQPIALPDPPVVGECLLDQTDFAGGFGEPLYPALRLAPCAGLRWGEVVSVVPGGLTLPTSITTTDVSGTPVRAIPLQERCERDVRNYLGVTSEQRFGWSMSLGTAAAVGPATRRRLSGASWVACVITPENGASLTAMAYHGSARNALAAGAPPPSAFATCSQVVVAGSIQRVACDLPHRFEVFGSTTADGTQAHLNGTCVELVRWLLHTPDPTGAGQLTVTARSGYTDPATGAAAEGPGPDNASTEAICVVEAAAGRQLRGTLLGLGARPIPWA